jgi:energy-coupling factor transporter ATP-binding protein EcfA2
MPESDDLVSRLYFGRDNAERDMAEGLLRDGFLQTQAYEAALSGRKTLVIGRKGSGKSAICMQLAGGMERASRTSLVTPDDTAGEELRRFELQGLTIQMAKSLIWRYIFAVQAARYLVVHAKDSHKKKIRSVRALGRFLKQNGETEVDGFYDRVLSGVSGLQTSISLEAFGIKGSMDFSKGQSEGARASKQLEVIEQGVARTFADLKCVQQHEPFLILVDQIEQVWSGDADSSAMVKGLLLAGHHVAGTTYGGALRCVLFLRSDIYDALDFGEGDKFHGDEMRISWTAPQLGEMALLRARTSLGLSLAEDELWGEVFPGEVNGEEVRHYLFSRSLPRPRDVIQFLNACRDQAHSLAHRKIVEQDVIDATQQFSEWKLKDLTMEYQVNYPFLARLFVMFQNTGYVVTRAGMRMRLEAHLRTLQQLYPDYVNAFTAQGLLDILYGIGFIGVKRGNDVVYSGGAQVGIQTDENEFHIHRCFRPALNSVMPTEIDAYEVKKFSNPWITAQGAKVQAGSLFINIRGSDEGIGRARDSYLLESLMDACQRILRQLGRSDLPADTRNQVSDQLGRVLKGAAETQRAMALRGSHGIDDPIEHIVQAAAYLNSLAAQLTQNGVAESGQGKSLVRAIQNEASGLIREMGGGYATR